MEVVVPAMSNNTTNNNRNVINPLINHFYREILLLLFPLTSALILACRLRHLLRNMPPNPWPCVLRGIDVWGVPRLR
ncbi:hypothetical protein BU23DRAFT_24782 [Bimuria novae-zelandiae CBS 107.79]|uniref:Uncharacterized protein n=1 Tax=Bimuria novae-zelandiae CBS 107.79 TaxID=1447943 RepID=A0A6A5UL62_9PLEO|nr:hypothetical protein BU23DRAFT_24782 [Bimuria novae-zelandiae CBS 107.79]